MSTKYPISNRIIKRIRLETKLILIKVISLFKTIKPASSILIFSDPRGGSTWLAELINQLNYSIVYWEPLNPKHNPSISKIGFGWRQHIPKNASWTEAKKAFDQILRLGIINEWTTMRFNTWDFLRCKTPIIKFCRGNHLIHWLCQQYSFDYKPVVLLRHPFAVVASQLKQGGWDYMFEKFKIPKTKFNEIYKHNEDFLKTLSTKEELLVATWCITNKDLLKSNNKWHTIYYESMILNPEKQLAKLFKDWKIEMPSTIYNLSSQASATNVDLIENDITKQLNKWQSFFDKKTIENMQKVLDHFAINIYSKDSLYPKI